jgi:hypothetical protein
MFGSPDLIDMVVMKVVFFVVLYLLVMFFEKWGESYLCGAVLGLVIGMGMAMTWMNGLAILEGMG